MKHRYAVSFGKRARVMMFVSLLVVPVSHGWADTIFEDGFESGDLSRREGGVWWSGASSVAATTGMSKSGAYAARFRYAGNAALDADSSAELRYKIATAQPELWIAFDLYVPSNYFHRDAISTDNNKFLRIGIGKNDGSGPGEVNNIGASTVPDAQGNSVLILENYRQRAGGLFISLTEDRGKWHQIVIQYRADTSRVVELGNGVRGWDGGNGILKIWKNGVLVGGCETVAQSSGTGVTDFSATWGYLLGWANSGFTETTDLYIDNVVFATSNPMRDVAPKAPTSVVVD